MHQYTLMYFNSKGVTVVAIVISEVLSVSHGLAPLVKRNNILILVPVKKRCCFILIGKTSAD